ncbi:phage tail tape measure protein [Pseudoxanthomonas winnipegensis]|uniref:Phage tail tape measure protein n=1 Tax=Pseudoxanthomonas winnipegensis TaxID=2480810 RepID=A0ABY1WB22_9GAMM|nr:phage tail length tape measure family protein [Pseudoxanthomonas winnipegensis]TAA18194.1 phage tail tape measure protein [Pseudoxanthomonas winnipegensis]
MADQTANLRVRISADLNDIKQGLGLVQRQVEAFKKSAAQPLPANNPVAALGVSAGQTANAMRQLPAQFTDIVTSLQGGMPFFTVLLQQGGQIRDSFGSTGAALKGVAVGLMGVVNPATVAAAAVGVLAVAYYKGAQESEDFRNSLIMTGGYVDRTADQLGAMSAEFDALDGVTHGGAAKALAEVAATGKFTGEQFDLAAKAAIEWQGATGRAIDETVSDFEKIAKDPVEGLLALNAQYHFLTEAQLAHIRALVEEGKEQEAVTEGFRIFSVMTDERVPKVVENFGYLQSAFNSIKKTASTMWDVILGVGRDFTLDDKVVNLQQRLGYLNDPNYLPGLSKEGRAKQIADLQAELTKARQQLAGKNMKIIDGSEPIVDNRQDAAEQSWKRITEKLLPEAEKRTKAIAEIQAAGDKAHVKQAEIDAQIARQRAEWAKQDSKKGAGSGSATRSAALQGYKDDLAQEQASLKADTDALKRQYDARTITIEDYYTRLAALTQQGTDAQSGALEKQIAYLRQQNVSGKEAVSVNAQIAQLEAQLAVVRTNGASAQKALADEEKAALKARELAIQSYTDALQASNVALGRQLQTMVDKVGMGDREYEIQQRINDAVADEADKQLELQAQLNANQIDRVKFDAENAALHQKTIERIDLIKAKYGELAAAEADWTNGARAAWANYAQGASDLASQVASATGDVLTSLEDVVVSAASRSKVSSKDMADSIIKDLERIAAKQLILGLGNLVAGWFGNAATRQAQATGNYGAFNPNSLDWTRTQLAEGGMPPAPASWYTGPGTKFQPAGIVHAGEGVLSQRDIAAIGGPSGFMAMLASIRSARGYADGGLVGASGGVRMVGGRRDIKVELVNNGAPATAQATITEQPDGTSLINIVLDAVADDIANGGKVGRAGKRRYGWKEPV